MFLSTCILTDSGCQRRLYKLRPISHLPIRKRIVNRHERHRDAVYKYITITITILVNVYFVTDTVSILHRSNLDYSC